MNILFMGGKQAGCIGLLTLCAIGKRPNVVVGYDDDVINLSNELGVFPYHSIKNLFGSYDLVVSVHGREIVKKHELSLVRWAINVHPCLYAYKGMDPVGRLLADHNPFASVGVHWMTDQVDMGETIIEKFVDVTGCTTRNEVYNILYPYYAITLIKAIKSIGGIYGTFP